MFDYRDVVEYMLILFHKKELNSDSAFPHTLEQLHEWADSGEFISVKVASGNAHVFVKCIVVYAHLHHPCRYFWKKSLLFGVARL